MAVIALKQFTGMIPRTPSHLLPDNASNYALQCDFAYGELKGIRDAGDAGSVAEAPKSLFTKDGVLFYYWPKSSEDFTFSGGNVETALSPVIADKYKRVYYTAGDGADIRVVSMLTSAEAALLANSEGYNGRVEPPTAITGGPTGTKPVGYKVGVPAPTQALTTAILNYDTTPAGGVKSAMPAPVSVVGNRTWYPVIAGLTLKFKLFYEASDGTKYQETDITGVFDGAYATAVVPRVAVQEYDTFAGTAPDSSYTNTKGFVSTIYGRKFSVVFSQLVAPVTNATIVAPIDGQTTVTYIAGSDDPWGPPPSVVVTTAVTTTAADPAVKTNVPTVIIPVIQVTGLINGVQAFSVFSEGSSFTSQRGTMGVKLTTTPDQTYSNTVQCVLDYGYRETRAFTYTNVNIFGEESAPALPAVMDIGWGQTPFLYLQFKQVDANSYAPIKNLRTYGTNTTSQGNTNYYFDEDAADPAVPASTLLAAVAAGAYLPVGGAHSNRPERYAEALTTTDFSTPQHGFTGLCSLPNGILACHRNTADGRYMNEVWFCEPYQPSAWPAKYAMTFPWDVVGIRAQGTGLVVITKGAPYYVYGTHPESMSQTKLQCQQAGVSKRAMADVGQYIVYASHDGLVAVSNTETNIELSQKFFTRATWRDMYSANLSNLVLAYHDGNLIGYFSNSVPSTALPLGNIPGFVIRMDEATGTFTKNDAFASCHFVAEQTDQLLFGLNSPAPPSTDVYTGIKKYASETTRQPYYWASKEFIMPKPVNMAVGQIVLDELEGGSLVMEVYSDGQARSIVTIISNVAGDKTYPSTTTTTVIISVLDVATGVAHTEPMMTYPVGATQSTFNFRLVSGFLARRWSVYVHRYGTAPRTPTVREIYLATSAGELQNV